MAFASAVEKVVVKARGEAGTVVPSGRVTRLMMSLAHSSFGGRMGRWPCLVDSARGGEVVCHGHVERGVTEALQGVVEGPLAAEGNLVWCKQECAPRRSGSAYAWSDELVTS